MVFLKQYFKTKGWRNLVLRLTHSVSSKCWFPADVIDLTKDKDDDLEKAIALSLQEAQVHQLWVGNTSGKSWNVVFHFKSALFWHRKRNTYSSLFVKTGAIKIIQLYLYVLRAFISDCLCKMPKFPGQSLILVVGASCKIDRDCVWWWRHTSWSLCCLKDVPLIWGLFFLIFLSLNVTLIQWGGEGST